MLNFQNTDYFNCIYVSFDSLVLKKCFKIHLKLVTNLINIYYYNLKYNIVTSI